MLWHHRSNSTAHTAVRQNASWCCTVSTCKELPVDTAWHPKRLEYSLTPLWKHQSLQLFIRIPDSCRHRWKEEKRHCSYFKYLYRCLSKLQATFFSRIPHWPKNKLSYSNGHVHIHESVVRFIKHAWTTLPHISVAVLWNVRRGSLHFQVEEPEDRGKSFFETLVLTYQTWLQGVTCEKSVIIVNFTKARRCLYQNDTALKDTIKIQIGRVHITWHCGAFVLET
jgi:hypothetical protein